MASEPGAPTLDQLRIFLTIVDTGSFAAAARTLNRANSVISYAIANLEAQLGLPLFDRESTRRPQLTAAGRSILAEALSRRVHSITSSARPSIGRGTVRASAFAVLRLMINSTFVACCTGRSAGFSPLSTRPV
jgi:DNA-binding transcriptional LysR family regulator